jgi:leucyl/phenylalanyl-tRNA--protein transferase
VEDRISKSPEPVGDIGAWAVSPQPPSGADLQRPSPELLLWAYGHSLFPMADPDTGRIDWFSPDPRAIFPLHPPDAFHTPRNVARLVRQNKFDIRTDTAFEPVMRACARHRNAENLTWISEQMIQSYRQLFDSGFAHSIEAWRADRLVGGLYGVHIGGAFFGESMFSRPDIGGSNSSKVCLVHLVKHLRQRGFVLLDTQWSTPHLQRFGCVEISAEDYFELLQRAIRVNARWEDQDGRKPDYAA